MNYPLDHYKKSVQYLQKKIPWQPEIGVILGSAASTFLDELEDSVTVDYTSIPHFLRATAPDHPGKMVFGTLSGKKIVCMSGRFHYYEGYEFEQLSMPIRVMHRLGVRTVILTNAAGGVNETYHTGDIMLLSDHMKFMGASPLRGKNDETFGPRFFDTTYLYDSALRALARRCAQGTGLSVHEGVYFFMPGPQFETPAEIRAIRLLGGDAVGMSTVTESLTAAHCGMRVLGISVITNMAAGMTGEPLSGGDVTAAGRQIAAKFGAYLREIVRNMEEA